MNSPRNAAGNCSRAAIAGLLLTALAPAAGIAGAPVPLTFEPNVGQTDASVRFLAHARGLTVFFTGSDALFVLPQTSRRSPASTVAPSNPAATPPAVVRLTLAGARSPRSAEGLERVAGVSNYYVGADPTRYRTGVPHFARIVFREVYRGIDLVCHAEGNQLEYDFAVAPGADPHDVKLAWTGADSAKLTPAGELVLATPIGEIIHGKPRAFQEVANHRVEVPAHYVLAPDHAVTIALAAYDRSRTLVIDPPVYCTYLGGPQADQAFAVAVNANGEAFVTGNTASDAFPNPLAPNSGVGTSAVFVTRFDSTGSGIVYSTYFGGGANDFGYAIAVDRNDSAYVTGTTNSNNFVPTALQATALQPLSGGGFWDAFVTKLSPAGLLVYSTYLGGNGIDEGHGIAVDSTGHAYVAGFTGSQALPTTSAAQPHYGGGTYDAFVAKLDPRGHSLVYLTYLGGQDIDQAEGIALDSTGSAYVTGLTDSAHFPGVSPTSAQPVYHNLRDAFVTKLAPSGAEILYSTYLGGSGLDEAYGIAVDSTGAAYIAGRTRSGDLAVVNARQTKLAGNSDAFVCKLAPGGKRFEYLTYFGGQGDDYGLAIALGTSTEAYIAGWTNSSDLPLVASVEGYSAAEDAFAAKFGVSATALVFSTYLGGQGTDHATGIAVDVAGAAYVVGFTDSDDLPVVSEFQDRQKSTDAFVTKLINVQPNGGAKLTSPAAGSTFSGSTVTFTWSSVPGATAYGLGVGTARAVDDIFQKEVGLATSYTVSGIPMNGHAVWLRLATLINGNVLFNDYSFKAFDPGPTAKMISPAPRSILAGGTVTFTWMPGNPATSYRLDVGTAVGLGDIFSQNVGLATSTTVASIPADGAPVFVRLSTLHGTVARFNDYVYMTTRIHRPPHTPGG